MMNLLTISRLPLLSLSRETLCFLAAILRGATLSLLAVNTLAQAPIIHPDAPGKPVRQLKAEDAIKISSTGYSPADVQFMKDMIPHHHQALQMAELVEERTNRAEIVDVAGRIKASQRDEIEFMQTWLSERNQAAPDPEDHAAMHTSHKMAGMATPEQMAKLAAATSTDFDKLFLELMIKHHEGAIDMVEELHDQPGAAYDPVLFEFTNEVTNSQESEIERMHGLLISLSDDPRAGLAAGFEQAEQAILNLALVGSLPKPAGFYDPANPAGLPPEMPEKDDDKKTSGEKNKDKSTNGEVAAVDGDTEEEEEEKNEEWERSPLFSFANTDIAFSGDIMVTGSYHGFNVYRLADGKLPQHLSSVVCPGGQGDVSIVGDILIMSVEQTRGRLDCGLEGVLEDVSEHRFRGLRIFNISDPAQPLQVGAVQTCRGSHTHSVVSSDRHKIVVYNSGTARVRDEEEMDGCIGNLPDERTALFRIDVIEIPVSDPSKSRIVASPAVFADPESGSLAGLWRGGDHGDHTQETSVTDQCHDITVFPEKKLAAGACSGNGILFDISKPLKPKRIDAVIDEGFAYWHSATFNNDGSKVIFTDEWGGGGRPRCRAYDPLNWGADAIYDIVDNKLVFRGHFKISPPQTEQENCVAHNGSIIPVPGRDIFVQAWYQGGISVIDFSDSAKPVEIAYFDRGPINEEHLVLGGYWSSYWYKGHIYGTEIARGVDILKVVPSEFLSENEIAAALLAEEGDVFNPQQQLAVTWPLHTVVARAYVDQLSRDQALSSSQLNTVKSALDRIDAQQQTAQKLDRQSSRELRALSKSLVKIESDGNARKRIQALAKMFSEFADTPR